MAGERCVNGRSWFNNHPMFIVFKYLGSRSFDSGIHCAVLQTCLKVKKLLSPFEERDVNINSQWKKRQITVTNECS